jgi:2-C-methyl-D-erythritol 2,4-cyclodiphosphate synthase
VGVRFDAGARRSILAATIEAEKHGRSRPLPDDLLMGLMSLPESPVATAVAGLGAEARSLIAATMQKPTGDGARSRPQSPEDAERILWHAGEIAAARGSDAEVGILDILAAALASTGTAPAPSRAATSAPTTTRTAPTHAAAVVPARARDPGHGSAAPQTTAVAGIGYDSHRFGEKGPLILGGISIPDCVRLEGHSDGDAIAHAITDAILGAAGAGDIGEMFPDTDIANRGRDSLGMLRAAVQRLVTLGYAVQQVDATVVAERPKIAPHREAMKVALAGALGIATDRVSVKGKTNEGMGWVGRGEGIACIAVATLTTSAAS